MFYIHVPDWSLKSYSEIQKYRNTEKRNYIRGTAWWKKENLKINQNKYYLVIRKCLFYFFED